MTNPLFVNYQKAMHYKTMEYKNSTYKCEEVAVVGISDTNHNHSCITEIVTHTTEHLSLQQGWILQQATGQDEHSGCHGYLGQRVKHAKQPSWHQRVWNKLIQIMQCSLLNFQIHSMYVCMHVLYMCTCMRVCMWVPCIVDSCGWYWFVCVADEWLSLDGCCLFLVCVGGRVWVEMWLVLLATSGCSKPPVSIPPSS